MKRLIACASLAVTLALPTISYAHDYHGDRDDRGGYHDRDGRGYRDDHDRYDHHDHRWHGGGPVRFIGEVIALPFVVGAAVIGAAVNVVTAPLNPRYYEREPDRAYYGPSRDYEDRDDRDERREYYAPPPRVYSEPPVYYYPPPPVYRSY